MSNMQLAAMLTIISVLFRGAIEVIEPKLPDDLRIVKKDIFGQDYKEYPILEPLYQALTILDELIENLEKEANTVTTFVSNNGRSL